MSLRYALGFCVGASANKVKGDLERTTPCLRKPERYCILNNFNKYGTILIIFGIDNRQESSVFLAVNYEIR